MDTTASLIAIGDEILYGQTLDTNTHWLAAELGAAGVKVVEKRTIADRPEDIHRHLEEAMAVADVLIFTGGLGPTNDDITKSSLAHYFNLPIVPNADAMASLEAIFASRDRQLEDKHRQMAYIPEGADLLLNEVGTAAGFAIYHQGKTIASMPGVPREMRAMTQGSLLPLLQDRYPLPTIRHLMVRTLGIGESWLTELIKDWEDALPEGVRLAYLPGLAQVKLRLSSHSASQEDLDALAKELLTYADEYVYGYGTTEPEEAVGMLLREQGLTLATAESCSGGYLSHLLTTVPGSSDYLLGGTVAYSNAAKTSQLGVSEQLLQRHGAVSREVAEAMAQGARQAFGADVAIATTGIAGPTGGSEHKPVGTVCFGLAWAGGTFSVRQQMGTGRVPIIQRTAYAALEILMRHLRGLPQL